MQCNKFILVALFSMALQFSLGAHTDTIFVSVNTNHTLDEVYQLWDSLMNSQDSCGQTITPAVNGDLDYTGSALIYVPDSGFTGIDSFSFEFCFEEVFDSANGGNDSLLATTNYQYDYLVVVQDTCDTIGCVYPGDANNDGQVNHKDLIYIGWGYNYTGPARDLPNISWVAQTADGWSYTSPDTLNHAFSDCNGDGVINHLDTAAITQNYNHAASKTDNHAKQGSGPVFYVAVMPDTAQVGDTVMVDLHIGTVLDPASDVYGFTASFSYHHAYLVPSQDVSVDFSQSWITGNDYSIGYYKNFYDQRKVEFSLTRTDRTTVNGHGVAASIQFIIEDNLDEKDFHSRQEVVQFALTGVSTIDHQNNEIALESQQESLVILPPGVPRAGDKAINVEDHYRVFPNPANDHLTVLNPVLKSKVRYAIHDLSGKRLLQGTYDPFDDYAKQISLAAVPSGSHLFVIQDNLHVFHQQIVVIK